MGNYVFILNFDKKEYIGSSKLQSYQDPYIRKHFDQCLLDLLLTKWRSDYIGAYDEETLDCYNINLDNWKDVTQSRKPSRKKKTTTRKLFQSIKKDISEIKDLLQSK